MFRNASAQCVDRERLSADQKLEALQKPLNRKDRAAVACVVAFMNDLSRRGDSRVIPILIRNLDLQLTDDEIAALLSHRVHLYGGEYPAMEDISRFGREDAPAPLLDAIAQSESGSVLSQNAVRTFMALEAENPPAAVAQLTQRAAKEDGRNAQKFMDAAKYAVSLWQCRNTLQACRDALKHSE